MVLSFMEGLGMACTKSLFLCCWRGKVPISVSRATPPTRVSLLWGHHLKELRYCVGSFLSKDVPLSYSKREQFAREGVLTYSSAVLVVFGWYIDSQQLSYCLKKQVSSQFYGCNLLPVSIHCSGPRRCICTARVTQSALSRRWWRIAGKGLAVLDCDCW